MRYGCLARSMKSANSSKAPTHSSLYLPGSSPSSTICGSSRTMQYMTSFHYVRPLHELRPYDTRVYDLRALTCTRMRDIAPPSRVLYTKAQDIPPNYLAIGDSVTALNPIFAQGFTKVCMGSLILDYMLRKLSVTANAPGLRGGDSASATKTRVPTNFAKDFFAAVQDKVDDGFWAETKTRGESDYIHLMALFAQNEL